MTEPQLISAILVKATTMADGGWRISFDVPQSEADKVLSLTRLRDQEIKLAVIHSETKIG